MFRRATLILKITDKREQIAKNRILPRPYGFGIGDRLCIRQTNYVSLNKP
jgi:hypothetical protein